MVPKVTQPVFCFHVELKFTLFGKTYILFNWPAFWGNSFVQCLKKIVLDEFGVAKLLFYLMFILKIWQREDKNMTLVCVYSMRLRPRWISLVRIRHLVISTPKHQHGDMRPDSESSQWQTSPQVWHRVLTHLKTSLHVWHQVFKCHRHHIRPDTKSSVQFSSTFGAQISDSSKEVLHGNPNSEATWEGRSQIAKTNFQQHVHNNTSCSVITFCVMAKRPTEHCSANCADWKCIWGLPKSEMVTPCSYRK